MVREKTGRSRYIAFSVSPPVPRTELTAALRRQEASLRLVEYDGARGLVRCAHTSKDDTIARLNEMRVGESHVHTLGTSGTIRKARGKYLPRKSRRANSPK